MAGRKRGGAAGGGGTGSAARANSQFATADCGSGNGRAAGREPGGVRRRGWGCSSDGGGEAAQGSGHVPRGSGSFTCRTRRIGCTGSVERAGTVEQTLLELLAERSELLL